MIDIKKMIAFEEGKRLVVYQDTKKIPTVGIGHNLLSDPALEILHRRVRLGATITEDECSALFKKDLGRVYRSLPQWFPQLPEEYIPVVINMIFQMGLSKTLTFYSPEGHDFTINLMLKDDFNGVISHIRKSKWYKDSPNRCERLIKVIQGLRVPEYE